jgi:8-oxo-dGTP diphosphatase
MAAIAARTLGEIDWERWKPVDEATLMFICTNEQVLLIHKKRGLGAGKINGPGGRLEPGETPRQAAIRETQEELCVTPHDPAFVGTLSFQFTDGYSIRAHLFRANSYSGTPTETDEAIPLWSPVDALPFDHMWQDDPYWLPDILSGKEVQGRFIFDADKMLDYHVSKPCQTAGEMPHGTSSRH